ncbi:MAG: hypothetical protein ACJ739_07490 [Acidimicrobiales bacterium]
MLKRTVAIAASAATLALFVTPPARAAGPDKLDGYAAGSSATALVIDLVDQSLALSSTTAAVSSEGPDKATAGPMAAADGAALLVAGTPVPSGAPSQTPGGQPNNKISAVDLDLGDATSGAADGLSASLAKVTTTATVPDGAPTARSEAAEASVNLVSLSGAALDPILGPLGDALEQVFTPADQLALCGDTNPILPPELCDVVNDVVDIDALVDEIIADIQGAVGGNVPIAQIAVGPSLSTSSADAATGVAARGATSGVFIELFPGLPAAIDDIVGEVLPDGDVPASLLTLGLGNAQAEVVRDPVTGKAAPDASAAQLVGVDVTDNLGLLSDLLEVQVPDLIDTLAEAGAALSCDGGALAPVICVDLGAVNELDADELKAAGYDFGAGTVGREASAAHIEVLSVLGDVVGGEAVLSLSLAQASAAANAVPATPAAPPAEPRQPLPRTGGDVNVPLALGLFAAAGAGLAAIRRTRTV